MYGDTAGTLKTIHKWFKRFCNACESIEDENDRECPLASKTAANVGKLSETI